MRGATRRICLGRCIAKISIHTPHAGSDCTSPRLPPLSRHFNPHSPCGERHLLGHVGTRDLSFQSTLPMRGATRWSRCARPRPSNFNPHSPCGERRYRGRISMRWMWISIHTPHAGSDWIMAVLSAISSISIHTPHAGSDYARTPSRHTSTISIHTPHAGSDTGNRENRIHEPNFNPHSPCGERPAPLCFSFDTNGISIHTPHAGSDSKYS